MELRGNHAGKQQLMITFDRQRIEITPLKIDGLIVLYATPSKGQIDSYLMAAVKNLVQTEEGVVPQWQPLSAIQSATKKFTESDFDGKNILEELHKIYIDELKGFNEGVKFTNTL